jgi:ribonuclease R
MTRRLPARADVLGCLGEAGRPLHARELASRLGVREGSYSEFLGLLDRLCLEGRVRRLAGSRYRVEPSSPTESWEGLLGVNPRGFGFVAAAGHPDVYVAGDALGGALHGDRVLVSIVSSSARGLEGRIEQILERRSPRVAGVLHCRGKSTWLEPDDSRIRGPIALGGRVNRADDGLCAVVSITRFPAGQDELPEAELVRVLGPAGDPEVELGKILEREGLTDDYPPGAIREAEAAVGRVEPAAHPDRVDLTRIPLVPIDPEDARDHDDAIWAERLPDGYRVWVAIADVAEFVVAGGELDQEARRRGCSVYLPDRAIPMLPPELSSVACSLLPGEPRLCLYVTADLDPRGKVRDFEVGAGRMRAAASLNYPELAASLGWTAHGEKNRRVGELAAGLLAADEVAKKLRQRRLRRGALDLDLPEPCIELDRKTGAPVDVYRRAEDPGVRRAYQLVEELMLLANELVAQWLGARNAPAVYRVHAAPDPAKLERLHEISSKLGAPCDLEEMLTPAGVSRWLAGLREHPRRGVLEMLLLRSLKQAAYDVTNLGHFGLASRGYLHFTSPIRRYPDLLVHRGVKMLLGGQSPDASEEVSARLRASATLASARERATAEVEREVIDLYRALFLRDRIGESFDGVVAGVGSSGLYVTLERPFVDVMVPFDALGPDYFEPAGDEIAVTGQRSGERIELGDRILVTIENVSVVRHLVVGRRVVREVRQRGRGRSKAPKDARPRARSKARRNGR